jgi:predicted TIM-barrel fold metal-dependent hydrolase
MADGVPRIISVDDHVIEPPHLWQERLPAGMRERGPKVVGLPWQRGGGMRNQGFEPATEGPETDFWQFENLRFAIPKVEVAAGLPPNEVTHDPVRYSDIPSACTQVTERLKAMDVAGIDRSLCFPNIIRFAGQLFLWMEDKELALACARAYNDWMVEEWAGESGGRLIPLTVIPLWDPGLAAAEVRRNADRGVRAATFSELPHVLGLPSIHDPGGHWLPFIEACEETGTVICMHIGSSSSLPACAPDAPSCVRMATVNFNAQLAFADWILSGLLVRYPRLKLAFSESQIGWMPYLLERADRIWRMGNAVARIDPAFVQAPSTYLAGRVYGCFFEDSFGLDSRHAVGVDHITFESDFPHQDSSWPGTHDYLSRVVADLPPEDVYKIARGNAIRMLELDPDPSPHLAGAQEMTSDA